MYYLLLTLAIIIIYKITTIIHPRLKERFIDVKSPNPSPSTTKEVCYGRAPGCIDRAKVNTDKDSIKVLDKFVSDDEKITVSIDLVYLDPKYQLDKTVYLYGKKNTMENNDWKQNFDNIICHSDKGGCQCIQDKDNNTVCGVNTDFGIYECANPCSECNQCHLTKSKITLKYQEFCNKAHTEDAKTRCEKYKERTIYSKEKCFFSDSQDKRLIKQREKCNMFLPSRYNGFFVGQDIIFHVKVNYLTEEIKDTVKYIEIKSVTLDNDDIIINNFYSSVEGIYFFIVADERHQGLSKIIEVKGDIFFKDKTKEKLEFDNKNVVNIFVEPETSEEEDIEEEDVEEEIGKKINTLLTKKKSIQSSEFDKYSNNYLGESRYYKCQTLGNYSVINPITELKNGSYKRKKIIDNPETWKQRDDINRPWDYIIN